MLWFIFSLSEIFIRMWWSESIHSRNGYIFESHFLAANKQTNKQYCMHCTYNLYLAYNKQYYQVWNWKFLDKKMQLSY